jgi:hypothetical protein
MPYRLPAASWVTPHAGYVPSAQLAWAQKLYRTVSVQAPPGCAEAASLNMVPLLLSPPGYGLQVLSCVNIHRSNGGKTSASATVGTSLMSR